jgi:hypothetical protein
MTAASVHGDMSVDGRVIRCYACTGAGNYLNQLFSFKFGPAISIYRMAFICFPPIGFAAVIHLHASDCIRYNAQQSDLSFGALDKSMHLGRQL